MKISNLCECEPFRPVRFSSVILCRIRKNLVHGKDRARSKEKCGCTQPTTESASEPSPRRGCSYHAHPSSSLALKGQNPEFTPSRRYSKSVCDSCSAGHRSGLSDRKPVQWEFTFLKHGVDAKAT